MDKDLRTALRSVVIACRQVLEEDVRRQLEGTYGVTPRGEFIAREDVEPYAVDPREWRRERDEILAAIAHIESYGADRAHAVEQFVRESAFTILNRLAALKLMEHPSRGLIPESVGRGKDSKGFVLFQKVSPEVCRAARNGPVLDSGFRLYLESIFDDLADELGVLFDRRLPQSIIFPSDACLKRVIELLNQPGIGAVWAEDETIGWIYQYFTPKELRDKARKESQAPRNSYELAFRNQFYTPRYVVEFLVDNTLGRLWLDMSSGQSQLGKICKHLVRAATEVFEDANGATTSEDADKAATPRTLIPCRRKRDPRELSVLDPACGSGHFLLYAFNLLEVIYLEAWNDPTSPPFVGSGKSLRDEYQDLASLRQAVPELIVRHNLHGIDVDLRASQIAALALWLRAQRSYQDLALKVANRPRITRSNIVCAEPMPGERELLEEFIASLQPRLLGQLVRIVFDKMALAGEAGSLLRIEDEIRETIAAAKKTWANGPQPEQLLLFPQGKRPQQQQLPMFDIAGISEESFWQEAESRVLESLREYAQRAANGIGYRRRLFADDSAQGFAFVDLCKKRFDVLLMNPPFGLPTERTYRYIVGAYPFAYSDLAAAFMAQIGRWVSDGGFVGAITTRAFMQTADLDDFRRECFLKHVSLLVDLGPGVMDEAWVEASMQVLAAKPEGPEFMVLDRRHLPDSEKEAPAARALLGEALGRLYIVRRDQFITVPKHRIAYDAQHGLDSLITAPRRLKPDAVIATTGLRTFDDERFYRLRWEVPPDRIGANKTWCPVAKNTEFAAYYYPYHVVVKWMADGHELAEKNREINGQTAQARQGSRHYFKPGVTFSRRGEPTFSVKVHPAGCAFSSNGGVVLPKGSLSPYYLCGLLNSTPFRAAVRLLANKYSYTSGHVEVLAWREPGERGARISKAALDAAIRKRELERCHETDPYYGGPPQMAEDVRTLSEYAAREAARRRSLASEILDKTNEIDAAVCELYELAPAFEEWGEKYRARPGDLVRSSVPVDVGERDLAIELVSFAVGCAFGRWDVRCVAARAELADPLAPIPTLPPAALKLDSQDGLPASYPITVDTDGLLVDDAGHPDDIVRRVSTVFEVLFGTRAPGIERDVCLALGVETLREYLINPKGFFDDHLKRYSQSQRRAPIYWLLQSSRRSYSLWIYYPRLDRDTVFKALRNYVEPRIKQEEATLNEKKAQLAPTNELSRRERSLLSKEVEGRESLLGELASFKSALEQIASLGLEPDLDDGVGLNAAPFHELLPWKDAGTYWRELLEGKHAWSKIAQRLREREAAGSPQAGGARHG